MENKKFDPKKINKLNDPNRLQLQPPDKIWKTLQLTNPSILVDIGAGTGFFAMPFCDMMAGGRVFACDSSDIMIDWMTDNLPAKYRDRVIPIKSDENHCLLEDDLADLVYMINLHHELDDPVRMLGEAVRILKKGGTLMVIDWEAVEMPMGPPLRIRIPAAVIAEQFKQAGLADVTDRGGLTHHSFITGVKPRE
ncbi:class I SAM-dependent methyltransferase [bacterium]|nr:class I SAM-dependent methyltransferase [bacterium]